MKKFMLLLLVALALSSCDTGSGSSKKPAEAPVVSTPVTPETPKTETPVKQETPVYVLNTLWKVLDTNTLSRSIESTDAIKEIVEAHNATTKNDKWYVYVGSYPSVQDSPDCDVYICDKKTNLPVKLDNGIGGTYELTWNDYPRQSVIDNIDKWKFDAQMYNAELYIDVIPPAPIITEPTHEDLYEKYTIRIYNVRDELIYIEHCSEVDLSGWACTLDEYFQKRVDSWRIDVVYNTHEDGPWRMETGKAQK